MTQEATDTDTLIPMEEHLFNMLFSFPPFLAFFFSCEWQWGPCYSCGAVVPEQGRGFKFLWQFRFGPASKRCPYCRGPFVPPKE